MKLTLTLTVNEAAAQIKTLKEVDEVVITNEITSNQNNAALDENYVEALFRVTRLLYPGYRSHEKIAAIKEFRSRVVGLGLAEAKHAIENPDKAIDFYLRTGRYFLNTF